MSTILRALRKLQKERERLDENSLSGVTSWRPPPRRRVPWLWISLVVLALAGTGWLVAVGPSPLALLDDTILVASNAVDQLLSDGESTAAPEPMKTQASPNSPKAAPAAKPRRTTASRLQRAKAKAQASARPKPDARETPVQLAQAEPRSSAAPTAVAVADAAAASDEAPPPESEPTPKAPTAPAAERAARASPQPEPAPARKQPPAPNLAATAPPERAAAPKPEPKPEMASEAAPKVEDPSPGRSQPTYEARGVSSETAAPDGFPRVLLTRVRWHPEPSRREARVELDQAGPFDAREGDIIAGVMVRRIEPAAVEVSVGGRRALVSISR